MSMSETSAPSAPRPAPSSAPRRLAAGLPSLTPGLLAEPKWAEDNGASPTVKDYSVMCRSVYEQHAAERRRKAMDLGKGSSGERLLYMNFKSHIIFGDEQRVKLFGVVSLVNPDLVCLSEALVPISLASRGGELCELSTLVDGPDDRIEQPYKACDVFAKRKLGHYGGEPKVMRGGWFEGFIQLGFEWVVFLSPTHCPYGANWGNCIVMKHKPDEVRCGHLKGEGCVQFKQVWDAQESRCYVGVRYGDHVTVSSHLDDVPAGEVRAKQAVELGEVCNSWGLDEGFDDGGETHEAAGKVEQTASAAAQAPSAPEAYAKKAQVEYRDASGNWVAATVVSVAFDDGLVPYYEITLNADGRDKSTVGERLRPLPAGQAPPAGGAKPGGKYDQDGVYEPSTPPGLPPGMAPIRLNSQGVLVATRRYVTLVGDVNAINPDTYDAGEKAILDKHNRGIPCPTDAVEVLSKAFGAVPLNTGQKFDCLFNKCVTHAYSTRYTHYIDLLTDATDFDHQPLALYRLGTPERSAGHGGEGGQGAVPGCCSIS